MHPRPAPPGQDDPLRRTLLPPARHQRPEDPTRWPRTPGVGPRSPTSCSLVATAEGRLPGDDHARVDAPAGAGPDDRVLVRDRADGPVGVDADALRAGQDGAVRLLDELDVRDVVAERVA